LFSTNQLKTTSTKVLANLPTGGWNIPYRLTRKTTVWVKLEIKIFYAEKGKRKGDLI